MRFAFVAKSATEGRLLLVRKPPVPPKEIAEAKKELGGGQTYQGRVRWENEQYVFELAKEPPGTLASSIRTIIHKDTGQTFKVMCKAAADLAAEEASAPAVAEPHGQVAGVTPAPPPQQAAGQPAPAAQIEAAHFMDRLKTLLPDIQKAEAAGHPLSPEIKLRASEVQVFARMQDFVQGNSVLDKIEGLVKRVLVTPPATPAADGPARFTARLRAILPDLAKAEAADHPLSRELKLRVSETHTLARAKDFVQANDVLGQVENLVKQILAATAQRAQAPVGISLVKLGRARVEWIATRTRALGDMQRLKAAIQTEFKNDPQQQAQLAAAIARLDAIFEQLNEDLGNQLDDVLNEKDPVRRQELAAVATGTMNRFLEYVASDEIMAELDSNEVVPEIQIAGLVRNRLKEIEAALGK
jgi:hypothetical protein